MSDASSVVALVSAGRRRLRLVAFVRLAMLMVPSAIAAASIVAWLVGSAAPGLPVTVTSATVLALMGAAVVAVARTPSSRHTAAVLDGRLQLEDRIVTSLSCLADDDRVAELVLRDTAARIKNIRLSRVFPIEMPARLVWALVAAAGAAALAAMPSGSSGPWITNQPGGGIITAGGRASSAPARGQVVRDQTDVPVGGTGVPAPQPADGTRPPLGPGGPRSSGIPAPATSTVSATPSPAPAPAESTTRTASSASSAPAAGTSPGGESARANGGGTSKPRESPVRGAGGSSAGPAGRARGASAGTSLAAVAAGGIAGGTLTARPRNDRALAPLDRASDPARYADALARAEAAIGHAQVSSAMREYVKRYFASIHPEQIK